MKELIPTFPRQVATPIRQLVKSESEFYVFINKTNGIKNLFYSLYEFNQGSWFYFDKIFFDFDGSNALVHTKILHKYLLENNYKHLLFYSGSKGFHIYLFLTNYETLKDPKSALRNLFDYLSNLLKITPDNSTAGDVARIARVPNTLHLTSKRYCIPITTYDLEEGESHIKDKAKEQNFQYTFFGDKLFDVSQFDYISSHYKNVFASYPELKEEIIIDDKMIKKFPKIFQVILLYPQRATYDAR